MKNLICIISGEPNSINSEIIGKVLKMKKKFNRQNFFIIGNYKLIKKQFDQLKSNIKLKKIIRIDNYNFAKNNFVLDVPLEFKNPFKVPIKNKRSYIMNCFKIAIDLAKKKKVAGFINCPINKFETFGLRTMGITEFLAKKEKVLGKEAMLIYNKSLSVSPITTHIKIKNVSKKITKKIIIDKSLTINNFYKKRFNIKPKIGILGLNPHNFEFRKESEESKTIIPAIKTLKKNKVFVYGPISGDTAFNNQSKKKYDVIIGMYHDQVLSPFKALYNFDAINVTLGLPYIRVSPDHGTGEGIIKKNLANPKSLVECIKFFSKING
ncbi:4-hydroxythreonine-4-phosphate dehydrogenase PdxA [Pelagibacteraceae bacterium]|nr:4-hydroxythreonine-4-phosphate dehydrogenase PdxA [Pelagibacteraceae bacterium]